MVLSQYMGGDERRELTNINLPWWDSKLEMPAILLSILHTSGRKSTTAGRVVPRGRPK